MLVGFHSSSSEELEKILSSESDKALFLLVVAAAVGTAAAGGAIVGDVRIFFSVLAGPLPETSLAALIFSAVVGAFLADVLWVSPRPFEPLLEVPPFTLAFVSGMPPSGAFFTLTTFVTDDGAGEAALPFAGAVFLDDSSFFFFFAGRWSELEGDSFVFLAGVFCISSEFLLSSTLISTNRLIRGTPSWLPPR